MFNTAFRTDATLEHNLSQLSSAHTPSIFNAHFNIIFLCLASHVTTSGFVTKFYNYFSSLPHVPGVPTCHAVVTTDLFKKGM